jgi:GNAT superfamily N-acetyltransferase
MRREAAGVSDIGVPQPWPAGAGASARLAAFLTAWLGRWPPAETLSVVGCPQRSRPGWDGAIHDAVGVAAPDGALVSVPPGRDDAVRMAADRWEELPDRLPAALGRPEAQAFIGTFRWCERPAPLPEVGVWLPATDPRLPQWLAPFGGRVLVALDGDRYAAGVGFKRHNGHGAELAVGTAVGYRGRGLAARLCAQAARYVLDRGAVPSYLHDPENTASARTAAAAGFPDRGWQVLGVTPIASARAAQHPVLGA